MTWVEPPVGSLCTFFCARSSNEVLERRIPVLPSGIAGARMASAPSGILDRYYRPCSRRRRLAYSSLDGAPQACLLIWTGDHRQTPGGLKNTEEAKAFRRKLMARPLALRCGTTYGHLDALAILSCARSCTNVPLHFQLHQDPAQLLKLANHWAFHLSLLAPHCNVIQASLSIQTECDGELHTCEPEFVLRVAVAVFT